MASNVRTRKIAAVGVPTELRALRTKRRSSILDPIITMDASGVIQSASDSVEHVFGWTPTELFGRNVKELIPEPRRSALDRYLDRYRHSDQPKSLHRTRRFEAQRKDGSIFQIELSMSRADLPPHTAPFFIGIIRDVTHEIDIGPTTADERSRIQQLVTEQTRALATANLRLQLVDRLAALGTLAAGLGHDMNNVLLPIRARLDALELAGMNDAALAHIKAVRRSLAYLQQLSDGLHYLAADPDGPGIALGGEGTTNLVEWWKQVGDLLRKAIPKRVSLIASISTGLPPVKIAPQWLTQAMLNLIVNAGEAIPQGKRAGRVRVWAMASDDRTLVRLGVADNGTGMTPKVRRQALDLFFTTKPRSMGTGLGLPLARKVASRAGGSLEITSKPNKGTTVVLTLQASSSKNSNAHARNRTARVSIRNPRLSTLVLQVLIQAGMVASHGNQEGPGTSDVWVTDPTLTNLNAAERWRSRNAARQLVLVGPPPKSTQARWSALGANVIPSSADFEAIRHTVGQVLSA